MTSPPASVAKPVRLHLSRRKGFDLQAASHAVNGLGAVVVSRPSRWGNQWKVVRLSTVCSTARQAVDLFRKHELPKLRAEAIKQLRGKNLGCWCELCEQHKRGKPLDEECDRCAPCHADPLGETANA